MSNTIKWADVDAIEVATVGIDTEQPVATGNECVTRMDGEDPSGYEFRAHSVYVHRPGVGATCIADCEDRSAAQKLGAALAAALNVPMDDYSLELPAKMAALPTIPQVIDQLFADAAEIGEGGDDDDENDLIARVQRHMETDDDCGGQSERLTENYTRATPDQQEVVDDIFICLCGWSLKSILAGKDK